ncbi:MAG: cellulase family glycosylhydrolase [Dehalococcoidia bacterium]
MTHMWRVVLSVFVLAGLVLPVVRPDAAAAQSALDYQIPGGWFYTQANGSDLGTSPKGYPLTNADGVLFFDAFKFVGGVDAVGYPTTQRFTYQGFITQAFQKAVFQWRPDQGNTVVFANIIDAIGDAGKDDWLDVVRSTPNRLPTTFDADSTSFQDTVKKRQALLDENPSIKQRYFSVPDPVTLYGLPTSRVVDKGNHFVVRFQRAIMQHYKEDVPWARKGQVLVANGGDLGKEAGIFPKESMVPSDPPGAPGAPQAQPAAAVPPPAGLPGQQFGYGFQVDQGNLAYGVDMTKKAGFGWVKFQIRWENLENAKGQINWGDIDRWVNGAGGLKVMLSVVTAPAWSRPKDTDFGVPGPPTNPQDFADFVSAIAARHKGRVHAIEIWNEQNLWYEWGGRGRKLSAKQYVDMLKVSYAAIKKVNPDVVVISGAPTPTGHSDGDIAIDDLEFLKQMYDVGLKDVSDAIGQHPSGFNNPPDDWGDRKTVPSTSFKGHGSQYFRRIEQFREVMVQYGDANKQIWLTEFGWASSSNPYPEYSYAKDNSEDQQATYLVRAFQIGKEKGWVGPMFVWNLNFAGSAEPDDRYAKKAFSVLYPDGRPRPAYGALAAMPK